MLKSLHTLLEGRRPTQEICHAMQAKIDTDETLKGLAASIKLEPQPAEALFNDPEAAAKAQASSPTASAPSTWSIAGSPPKTSTKADELEELMTVEEMQQLQTLIRQRQAERQAAPVDLTADDEETM